MSLENMLLVSVISVASALFFVLRIISWRTLLQYRIVADVLVTALLVYLFRGTITGMIVAAATGLFFSLVLTFGNLLTPKREKEEL